MRAMKRTVSVLLSLMLVLGMMTIGMSVASAAETKVTATSNIGATASAAYTASSEQVTVTYKLNTAATISGVHAVITYDKAVLKLATTNTAATCFPTLNESLVANLTKTDGRLPFNASSYNGYNFAGGAVLATVVFDIIGTGNTTVDLEVKALISITNPPSQTDADEVVIIDDETNDTSKYTATAEVTVYPEASDDLSAFINDVRINLEGKIGIDFYFYNLPEGYTSNSNLYVVFDGPSTDENANVNGTAGKKAWTAMKGVRRNNVNCRKQSYFVCAYMMTVPLKVSVYDGNELKGTYSVTVADWAYDHMAEFEASNADAAVLLKRMLNYGAAVQEYFAANLDDKFTAVPANSEINYALQLITADQIQVPSGLMVVPTLTDIGISQMRQNVELKEGVDIQLTVRIGDQTKFANAAVSVDGTNLPFEQSGTGTTQKRAILYNVVSNKLDNVYTFNFSNGTNYKTSVMAYVKNALAGAPTNTGLQKLVSAMYWYNASANTVFGD